MKTVWNWIKRNWKWILFPVGIIAAIVTAIASSRQVLEVVPDTEVLEGADTKRDLSKIAAEARRNAKLKELEEQHKDRINKLSEEQKKELNELSNKPISEVVKWFDNF